MKNGLKLNRLKIFFFPVKIAKKVFLKGGFVCFFWGINSIVHILFLERFTYFLERGEKDIFFNLLIFYGIYIFSYEIVMFLTKKWGWVEAIPRTWNILSKKYLSDFIKLDNNKIELEGTGKLISIIGGGIRQWGFSLWNVIEKIIRLLLSILFAFFMVIKVNIFYGIIFIFLFVMISIISAFVTRKMDYFRKLRNENINIIYKNYAKIIMSKMEILQTDKIDHENGILNNNFKIDEGYNKQMSTYRTFLLRNADFILGLFFLISYYYLGNSYFNQSIQLSTIVGFGGALIIMQKSISESISFYVQFTKDYVIINKLLDFFETTNNIGGYDTGKDFVYKSGNIELKNLYYGYSKDKLIFKNFDLKIKGGEITAFVGPSGGGKTTLVKLISGYIKANSGEIIIDGQNISETSLKTYYKDIGYLTQEPSVFDGTVLENLTYAIGNTSPQAPLLTGEGNINTSSPVRRGLRGGINEKHLNKIIKLAKCEFIYDLPNGLDTEIGERGVRLSGGQKQRLSIAKIFLKDPKIIILDEPTSALDSFSEEQITKAMNNLFAGRTVIIIAHRLQTVKHADEIIVIEAGEVIERGKHSELIKQKGHYKKMLDLQSGF